MDNKTNVVLDKRLNFLHVSDEDIQDKSLQKVKSKLNEFPFQINKPHLLTFDSKCGNFPLDPYNEIIDKKHRYNMEVETLKSQYRKSTKNKHYNLDKFDFYTEMQAILSHDPDEFFNSDYNWYYSGGNLDAYNHEINTFIFYPVQQYKLCKYKNTIKVIFTALKLLIKITTHYTH